MRRNKNKDNVLDDYYKINEEEINLLDKPVDF